MAKEFDIDKIERAGQEDLPKLMTDAYTKELSPKTGVEPNAEIEKGEYIMYPDGTTQKAIGETHSNGGMMMNLPDGTRVLSNYLTVAPETRKELESNFDMKVSKKDTYSKVLDNFLKKIGYEKVVQEQEEAFEALNKLLNKKSIDRNTLAVNREFLSKKIFDIETKKQELEKYKKEMFDLLYNEQEDTKSLKEKNEDGEYKYGGLKRSKFEDICRKNGMTVEEGMRVLSGKKYEYGGKIPKYQEAGKHTISSGETFYGIANKYGLKFDELTNANPGINIEKIKVGQVINVPQKGDFTIDMDYLKKGISHVESADGVLMKNPNSSATGLYGQLFNELTSDIYSGTRDQFAKDKEAQNKVFNYRYNTGIGGNSLKQDAKDIINEYQNQIDLSGYSNEDIVALVNFLGRQGTRKYFGNVVRDNKSLEEVFPNLYGKNVEATNKTPKEYLESFRSVKRDGGYIRKYQDGGDSIDYDIEYEQNPLYKQNVKGQKTAGVGGGYGEITNAEDALNALYTQFPDIVLDVFGSDVKVEGGRLKLVNKDIKLNTVNPKVKTLQKRMDSRMRAAADLILSGRINVSQDEIDAATKYKEEETFVPDTLEELTEQQRVRQVEGKLGEFTSGRYLPNIDLLTPEEIEKSKNKGYTTAKQVKADEEFYNSLSDDTKARFDTLGDLGDADFFISDYETIVPPEEEEEDIDINVPKPYFPRMFAYPYQYVRPPMGMQATLFPEVRLSRLDPIKLSPEQQLQAISDARSFSTDQLSDLNPVQRASALSQLTGTAMGAEAKAIRDTNVMNMQNQAQTDLFNAGQRDKESMLRAQNALGYEARTFTALDKTDKDMRDWELYNNKQALAAYDYNRKMNLMASIFPQFNPDFFGQTIEFDPTDTMDIEERRDYLTYIANNLI